MARKVCPDSEKENVYEMLNAFYKVHFFAIRFIFTNATRSRTQN